MRKLVDSSVVARHFAEHNWGHVDGERTEFYGVLGWDLRTLPLSGIGVWDEAQGMPHEWCIGNVLDTAKQFVENGDHVGVYRERVHTLLREEDLGEIIVIDGKTRRGRERCGHTRWSIDDGCMRAIAHALRGHTHVACYVGTRKNALNTVLHTFMKFRGRST